MISAAAVSIPLPPVTIAQATTRAFPAETTLSEFAALIEAFASLEGALPAATAMTPASGESQSSQITTPLEKKRGEERAEPKAEEPANDIAPALFVQQQVIETNPLPLQLDWALPKNSAAAAESSAPATPQRDIVPPTTAQGQPSVPQQAAPLETIFLTSPLPKDSKEDKTKEGQEAFRLSLTPSNAQIRDVSSTDVRQPPFSPLEPAEAEHRQEAHPQPEANSPRVTQTEGARPQFQSQQEPAREQPRETAARKDDTVVPPAKADLEKPDKKDSARAIPPVHAADPLAKPFDPTSSVPVTAHAPKPLSQNHASTESSSPAQATPLDVPELASARSEPARDISFRISSSSAESVDVKLVDKAGQIQVAVRSTDPALTKSLQENVNELAGKLERSGFHTETSIPNRTEPVRDAQQSSAFQDSARDRRAPQQEYQQSKKRTRPSESAFSLSQLTAVELGA